MIYRDVKSVMATKDRDLEQKAVNGVPCRWCSFYPNVGVAASAERELQEYCTFTSRVVGLTAATLRYRVGVQSMGDSRRKPDAIQGRVPEVSTDVPPAIS